MEIRYIGTGIARNEMKANGRLCYLTCFTQFVVSYAHLLTVLRMRGFSTSLDDRRLVNLYHRG